MKVQKLALHTAVVAVIAGLAASQAVAGGNLAASTPTNYAMQAVAGNSNVVTVASGRIVYTSITGLNTGAIITINLPTGMTFGNTPSLLLSGGSATVTGGGAGAGTMVVSVGVPLPAGATVTLGAFNINNATALTSPTALNISAQATGDLATPGNNDPQPVTSAALVAQNGITYLTVGNFTNIDVAPPSSATQYRIGGVNVKQTLLGQTQVNPTALTVAADGVTPYVFPAASKNSVLASGNFSTIPSAYAKTPATATCPASAPGGAIAGTVTSSSLEFAGLTTGLTYDLCIVTNGTAIIQANVNPVASAVTVSGVGSLPGPLGTQAYNGAVQPFNYAFGGGGGYTLYFNGSNPTTVPQPVTAVVNMADGAIFTGQLPVGLPAQGQTLYSINDIAAATSAPLVADTDRATITLLAPNLGVTFGKIVLNPGGNITETIW